jgi:signal transduction histidine kinase
VSTSDAPTIRVTRGATERHERLRACTLLLVDDEEANLDLLEALLGEAGYGRVVRTTDPLEVMTLAAEHAPDLVLLDLHMPHRHGLDVLSDLCEATPEGEYRPVLVLTADVTSEARERALAFGARDFVTKPFDAIEVVLRVENLLDARVLHVDERRARQRAEMAEARAALLAEWSRALAASLDPLALVDQLRALVVPCWAAECEIVLDSHASEPSRNGSNAAMRLTAPIQTDEGTVGWLTVEGMGEGARAADQALVNELAARIGMAAEHARLLAAAERATRERERLLAVVAHDLRNPLGAIAMYAEMLSSLQPDAGVGDPYTRGALASIHSSAAAMQRLVEDLLDAGSLRGGALRLHRDVRRVAVPFEEAERMLRPLADAAGVRLAFEEAPNTAGVVAAIDHPRIVQLLSNVVGNAIKFTPPGGDVSVRYGADADGITASVTDSGMGISPDELPHLFAAFWRGDAAQHRAGDSRRGVGLGLWIAQSIVEAHGGTLRVESVPGSGTTFHIALPFAPTASRWED